MSVRQTRGWLRKGHRQIFYFLGDVVHRSEGEEGRQDPGRKMPRAGEEEGRQVADADVDRKMGRVQMR